MALTKFQQIQQRVTANKPAPAPVSVAPITPATTAQVAPIVEKPKFAQNFGMGSAEGGRLAPTVATPKQPVISKTLDTSLTYDPADPQDYLMRLQAKTTTGKIPTETEYYNALKAQNDLKAKQETQVNPLQSQLDALLAQQSQLKEQETTMDTEQLDAYKRSLEQQYWSQKEELLSGAERQKQSAQWVYSFSWFGRSTAAADKMVEIQKSTDNAINTMNAAKEAAIIAKQAELAGADSASLSELNKRIAQYQDEANKRQIESLKKTAEANQSTWASYIDSLNNLMETATKSGMDIGKPEDIQLYAQLARRPDWSINEEFISALPEWMQAIIRTANISSSPEAAKTVTVWSGKSARVFQRNPATWKYDIPVGSWGAGGWSWSWGWWAGGWTVWATSWITPWWVGSALDLVDYNVKFKNQDQSNAFSYATRMIEASDVFNQTEDQIAWLSKWEYILQKSYGKLPYWSALQSDTVQKQAQAEQNFINAVLRRESGAAIWASEYNSAEKQYFPQPWDSAAVLEQKRKNRLTALKWISAATGNQKALVPAINTIAQKKTTQTPINTPAPVVKSTTWAGRWNKK